VCFCDGETGDEKKPSTPDRHRGRNSVTDPSVRYIHLCAGSPRRVMDARPPGITCRIPKGDAAGVEWEYGVLAQQSDHAREYIVAVAEPQDVVARSGASAVRVVAIPHGAMSTGAG
jgi:hypothetical protein